MQTYTCTGAPVTGGTGIGIVGFSTGATVDNFSADPALPSGGPVVVPVPTLTKSGLLLLAGLLALAAMVRSRRRLSADAG